MAQEQAGEARAESVARLLEEIAEDNTALVSSINRVLDGQKELRSDVAREMAQLREDFVGALTFRALKDVCRELMEPLAVAEAMLERADFGDAESIRGHVKGLAIVLRNILSRMGVERVVVALGEEVFDPHRHQCARVLPPEESPFPNAAPRTVVRVVEDGFTLAGRVLSPARVEVQAEKDPERAG